MTEINMISVGGHSESIQKCIDSFAKFHTVNLWEYPDPTINHQFENCINKDANEIFPQENLHKNLWNKLAICDWLRINLIYQLGGWYSDCDNYCLASLDDLTEPNIFTYLTGDSGRLINSIFKCEKGSPILKNLIDTYTFDPDKAAYIEFSDKCSGQISVYLHSEILHTQMKELDTCDLSKVKVIHLFATRMTERNLGYIQQIKTKFNVST